MKNNKVGISQLQDPDRSLYRNDTLDPAEDSLSRRDWVHPFERVAFVARGTGKPQLARGDP